MHQYIKYLLIIFGSVSIMLGCDNNNNNCDKKLLSNKHVYCLCCPPNELFTLTRGRNLKGLFKDSNGFIMHFCRNHYNQYKAEIKKQPYAEKEEYKKNNFMGTITEPTTPEVLEKIRSQQQEKWNKKNTSSLTIPTSPLLMPIGSPTIFQHNKTNITSDSEPESDECSLKKIPAQVISRTKKRYSNSHSKKTFNSTPKSDSKPQFFPEDDLKKEIKKLKTDAPMSASTDILEQRPEHISFDMATFALVSMKKR